MWYKTKESRERAIENARCNGKKTGAKNLGSYMRSKTGRKQAREHILIFNKSETGRERAKKSKNLSIFIKSEEGKEFTRRNGKITGPRNLSIFNKSEAGRERSRKNIAKVRAMITTESQKNLSKALTDNGIHNHMEHYFPEIRRLGDIAISSSKLIIEVDGSSHEHGICCTKEEKQADDKYKEAQIKSLGWNIIRFKNEEIETNLVKVIAKIKEQLNVI